MSGNDRIDSDLFLKLYKLGDQSKSAGWGEKGGYYYEFASKYPVNPDIKWETTITRNLGIDFGFLNGKIDGSFDVYWNTTKDLLLETILPGDTGFTSMMTNVGQTSNKGFEVNLNAWVFENKDWTVGLNFNIGLNRGKIDKLNKGENELIREANVDSYAYGVFRHQVGQSIGNIYGFVNDGMYTLDDFNITPDAKGHYVYELKEGIVNSKILCEPQPGTPKFKELVDDGTHELNPDKDRTVIGNTTPDFSGGFGVNVKYRDFDLAAQFNYMVGFDVININKMKLSTVNSSKTVYQNLEGSFANMWHNFDAQGSNVKQDAPEVLRQMNANATMWDPTNMTKTFVSTYCVEDGSFMRLQNLTLGYTIPSKLTKKIGMSRCRFYATGYNLFTITNYSGYDPEVNIGEGLSPNQDYNMYPRSRSYTFGVQVSF